jgi:hypothetical protein
MTAPLRILEIMCLSFAFLSAMAAVRQRWIRKVLCRFLAASILLRKVAPHLTQLREKAVIPRLSLQK